MIISARTYHGIAILRGVLLRVVARFFFANLRVGRGVRVWGKVTIVCDGSVIIHPGASLGQGVYIQAIKGASVQVGEGSSLNTACHVVAMKSISIGSGTMIGEFTSIRDADHVVDRGGKGKYLIAPVSIGAGAWIGRGCFIGRNASIPDYCTIGANSIVRAQLAESGTYVGCPVRRVKKEMTVDEGSRRK